jgi:sensor histidine kinase YesM
MDNEEAQRRTEEHLRDRTMLCDGKFEIASEKNRGTTVHISLPCDAETIGGPA